MLELFNLRAALVLAAFITAAGCSSSDSSSNHPDGSYPDFDIAPIDESWTPDCASDLTHFENEMWAPLLSFQCISCHTPGSIADHTRLLLVDGHTQHNFETLWALAQEDDDDGPLLLMHPSGRGSRAHTGGDLIEPGTSTYEALEHWVSRARGEMPCVQEEDTPPDLENMQPGPRLLRRLSHKEYLSTIYSLFPYASGTEFNFAPDNVVEGYANNADALIVSPLLSDQYRETAETLGQLSAQNMDTHLTCDPEESGPAHCTSELLRTLGLKIFRRPLTTTEAQRYFDLWYEIATDDGYLMGLQWMLTAMLQSPGFLYRSEVGTWQPAGHYQLSAYEVATELAYNLTGTMPDTLLFEAAQNGTLATDAGIIEQATRLMQTDDGADQFWTFMEAWLGLDQIKLVTRSTEAYPELTPSLRQAMLGQTKRLTQDIFAGGRLEQLFDNPSTYLTTELAQYYGIATDAGSMDAEGFFKMTQDSHYQGGILTEGAFLTTYAKASSSSPIHRGILVREKLLCQPLPPPPANLDTSPPAMDLSKSTRERYAEHAQNPACNGCHSLIDPIGFAFEHFDGIGRYREMDGNHIIDDSGEIVHSQNTDAVVDGAKELSTLLSTSTDVQKCFTHQWLLHTYGLHEEPLLETTETMLGTDFVNDLGAIQNGILAMVQTPHFQMRAEDPDLTGTANPEPSTDWTTTSLLGAREEPIVSTGSGPITPAGLTVEISEATRWNTGACFDVSLINNTDGELTWEIEIPLEGTLENLWSAEVSETLVHALVVHGLNWNETLAPAANTTFGYCVSF